MKITVIPAIDVIGGKCVRLTRGNYDECKTYYNDPWRLSDISRSGNEAFAPCRFGWG
ncbi:MAG: HisA/HisF-related TIM barrel protein [Butyricimonas faecihominis]